jgi:uncharacterized protein
MKYRILNLFVALFVFSVFANGQTDYAAGIEKWRVARAGVFKLEDSWLTVAGLFWLKEGVNTVGAGAGFDVELTENFKQGKFGEIIFQNGKATLKVENGIEASVGGRQISEIELVSDDKDATTIVQTGSQSFYLIEREARFGIRLKDKNSRERVNFTGLKWFPVDEKYKIEAEFESYKEPKEILIPNVLGGNYKMKSPGLLHFKLKGRKYTLESVVEDLSGGLFIIFRDATSKRETYGAGRFLYTKKPENGKVILDFNRAENPPCAYTAFATCPLPPLQNRLKVEIKAGEKRYH